MKNIFKFLPVLAIAMACASCNDLIDDKDVIDAKYSIQLPTLNLSSASAVDYSTVSVSYTASSTTGIADAGVQVSTSADFATSDYFSFGKLEASASAQASGLAPDTKYYVRVYAYTSDNCAYSNAVEVTTPSVPLTAALLEGKVYKANVVSYFDDPLSFAVSFIADEDDPYKMIVCNLDPYFYSNGFTAEKETNMYEAELDPETGIITVYANQEVGYQDVVIMGFNDADPDVAEDYDDVHIQMVNYGASLNVLNSFGVLSSGGWYNLYYGGITLKP